MFFDNYLKLCASRGISPSTLAVQLGVGKGTYSGWKKGAQPINPTKKIISDYFGITVTELMSGEIKKPATISDDGLSNMQRMNIELMKGLTPDEEIRLNGYLQGLKDRR